MDFATDRIGDLALRFRIASQEANTCSVAIHATGVVTTVGPPWFHRFADAAGWTWNSIGGAGGRGLEGYARIHAGNAVDAVIDSSAYPYFPDRWIGQAVYPNHTLAGADDWLEVIIGARSLQPLDEGARSLPSEREALGDQSVNGTVECTGPFLITDIAGSREAYFFDEASMHGGVGAHANFLAPSGVAAADGFAAQITAAEGLLYMEAGGDLLLTRAGGGIAQVQHPEGEDLWVLLPPGNTIVSYTLADSEREYRSTAGTYSVLAVHASVLWTAKLEGVLLGFSPLTDLDDVLRE